MSPLLSLRSSSSSSHTYPHRRETREMLETELGCLADLVENRAEELGDIVPLQDFFLRFGRLVLAWKTGGILNRVLKREEGKR